MSNQLTPEELQEFQSYRTEVNNLASVLGELTYQKTLIDFELDSVKANIKEVAQKQRAQLRELGNKYGNVLIDFETGKLTPQEVDSEQSESQE
jgi:hypothetical protein